MYTNTLFQISERNCFTEGRIVFESNDQAEIAQWLMQNRTNNILEGRLEASFRIDGPNGLNLVGEEVDSWIRDHNCCAFA